MIKSPFKKRAPKDFKILIFYPNLHMSALMPQSVGIFTALLKREGYQLDLFDCTYYQDIDSLTLGKNTNEEKVENRNVHKYDNTEWHEKGVKPKIALPDPIYYTLAKYFLRRINYVGVAPTRYCTFMCVWVCIIKSVEKREIRECV